MLNTFGLSVACRPRRYRHTIEAESFTREWFPRPAEIDISTRNAYPDEMYAAVFHLTRRGIGETVTSVPYSSVHEIPPKLVRWQRRQQDFSVVNVNFDGHVRLFPIRSPTSDDSALYHVQKSLP